MRKRSKLNLIIVALGAIFAVALPVIAQEDARGGITGTVQISQRPITNYLLGVRYQLESREISLASKFSAEYRIAIDKSGAIDQKTIRLDGSSGDPKLIQAVARGIAAFGDAGYFSFLSNLEIDNAVVTVSHDGENFVARLVSDTGKPDRARFVTSGLKAMISIGRAQAKSENDRLVLENTSVSADKTNTIISLAVTKSIIEQLIWEMD